MSVHSIIVQTQSRTQMLDITSQVSRVLKENKVQDGLLALYVPHTTAALTINENADPSVQQDILSELNRLVPLTGRYQHTEGNAAAHVQSTLVGPSQIVFIEDGRLKLGTWQGIFLCEFDGPRKRTVWLKILPHHGS